MGFAGEGAAGSGKDVAGEGGGGAQAGGEAETIIGGAEVLAVGTPKGGEGTPKGVGELLRSNSEVFKVQDGEGGGKTGGKTRPKRPGAKGSGQEGPEFKIVDGKVVVDLRLDSAGKGDKKGMAAASSQAGGKGVNCIKFGGLRYDGFDQKQVAKDLQEAEREMVKDPLTMQAKSKSLLSPYDTIKYRAQDLSTWLGVAMAPDEWSTERDEDTGMVLVRYDGEFDERNGQAVKTGHATVRAANGIVFEGEFLEGAMQGPGKILFASGNSWEGEFDRGRLHGKGTFTWNKPYWWPESKDFKKQYTGILNDGKLLSVGEPSTYQLNKDCYEGEFVDGVAHGKGVMLWADGRWYDGEWQAGKPHGQGTLCMPDGSKKSGFFEPCAARWYDPLRINKAFWPGQLHEGELLEVDQPLAPACERMR